MPAFRKPGANSPGTSRSRARRALAAAIPSLVCLALTGGAAAEVYRCVDGAGRITFTDDATTCPGAGQHRMQPRFQRVTPPPDAAPAAPKAPVPQADPPSAEEQQARKEMWRLMKQNTEAKLRTLEQRLERLQGYVTQCNRGMEFFGRDAAGMKYHVSCDEIHKKHAAAQAERERLREYLESGLALECRRAGCLPGWIR